MECRLRSTIIQGGVGVMSPYTLYFGKLNSSSYSSLLGSSYKYAKTEYGLCAVKMMLIHLKELKPDIVLGQEELKTIIEGGDQLFDKIANEEVDGYSILKKLITTSLKGLVSDLPSDNGHCYGDSDADDLGSDEENLGKLIQFFRKLCNNLIMM
jgi:hypothetical protein